MNTVTQLSNQPKVRLYGINAAMTVEATILHHNGEPTDTPTVSIDIAKTVNRQTNWKDKITVQLSEVELPLLCAVCLGYLPEIKIERQNKGISFQRQPNKIYVKGSEGTNKQFSLPIPMWQTFQLSTLGLEQLQKQSHTASPEFLLAAIRGASALYR